MSPMVKAIQAKQGKREEQKAKNVLAAAAVLLILSSVFYQAKAEGLQLRTRTISTGTYEIVNGRTYSK
jgi:hypothetical protein